MTQATLGSFGSRSFSYDRFGNLTANGSLSISIDAAKNRVTSGGGLYDNRGNMTVYNAETLRYDALSRQYRDQNTLTDWTYVYDGGGERVVKFPSGTNILRREMARLLTEANIAAGKIVHGVAWALDACTGIQFTSPLCSDPDANYIQTLYDHAVAGGCGGSDFCQDSPLTRGQMAVFVVTGYLPEPTPNLNCTGMFADVPCSLPSAKFIEKLATDHVTAGCGGGNFCPNDPVTSWQILVWMSAAPAVPGGSTWASVYHPVPRSAIYTYRDEQSRIVTEAMQTTSSGGGSTTLSVTRDNVFFGNLLVASNSATGWQYTVSDHLGTPRCVFSSSTTCAETHRYWPYGEGATAGQQNQRLAFAGMERDTEANRYYDHARHHEFNLGRFLSPEPTWYGAAAEPQTWNPYSYSYNSPVYFQDRNGEFAWAPVVVIAALGGVYNGAVDVAERIGEGDKNLGRLAGRFGIGFVAGAAGTAVAEAEFLSGSPILAGATAGFVTSALDQGLNAAAYGDEFSVSTLALDTVTSGLAARVAKRVGVHPGAEFKLFKGHPLSWYLTKPKIKGRLLRGLTEAGLAGAFSVGGRQVADHSDFTLGSVYGPGYLSFETFLFEARNGVPGGSVTVTAQVCPSGPCTR